MPVITGKSSILYFFSYWILSNELVTDHEVLQLLPPIVRAADQDVLLPLPAQSLH